MFSLAVLQVQVEGQDQKRDVTFDYQQNPGFPQMFFSEVLTSLSRQIYIPAEQTVIQFATLLSVKPLFPMFKTLLFVSFEAALSQRDCSIKALTLSYALFVFCYNGIVTKTSFSIDIVAMDIESFRPTCLEYQVEIIAKISASV